MPHHDARPLAPLAGTTRPPRGLFVDLWGTLLVAPAEGFVRRAEDVAFVPGALDALFRATRAGWRLYLLGNQEAVAFGRQGREAWDAIEAAYARGLAGAGVTIARSYVCLSHPEGVSGQRSESVYLLPNTGAFYHAAHTDGIELRKSWVVGDSTLEIVAGWRAGCRQAAVRSGLGLSDATFAVEPDLLGDDLAEVVLTLLGLETALHP